jgi:copper chaperone CopZ
MRTRALSRPARTTLALAVLFLAGGAVRAADAPLTQVRFQLRSECTCASCGFAMDDQLHKQPGVAKVSLSARERTVTVAFDEQRAPLSRVAALLAGCEIGKRSALIGELTDAKTAPDAASRARVAGVRAVEVDAKKHRLLVELAADPPVTTAELTAALAKAGVAVRFERVPPLK